MIEKDHIFCNVQDRATLGRLQRSQDIRTVRTHTGFIAVNLKNGNKYQVMEEGKMLICTCPDSAKGYTCKHEIGVARDIRLYEEV